MADTDMSAHPCNVGFTISYEDANCEGGLEDGQPVYMLVYRCSECGSVFAFKQLGTKPS